MNSTTLRGVFPDPKPVFKRNFIKENVKHIKRMQGPQSEESLENQRTKVQNRAPIRVLSSTTKKGMNIERALLQSRSAHEGRMIDKVPVTTRKRGVELDKAKGDSKKLTKETMAVSENVDPVTFIHRGVQTEKAEDIQKLYDTGVIRYPSPALLKSFSKKKKSPEKREKSPSRTNPKDRGDTVVAAPPNISNNLERITEEMQNLDFKSDHDYIKQNIMAIKNRANRTDRSEVPSKKSPPKIGILPKYLKERKDLKEEFEKEVECPPGHVLLPDEERKETLRVLRQSYADRIQELNSMPVRNDTLRMRNRKMAIEEELKKIDEGIKVFQRPKVFVKVNA